MLTASIQMKEKNTIEHASVPLIDAPYAGPLGVWGSLGDTIRRLSRSPSPESDPLPALERVFALSAPGWIRQTRIRLRVSRTFG